MARAFLPLKMRSMGLRAQVSVRVGAAVRVVVCLWRGALSTGVALAMVFHAQPEIAEAAPAEGITPSGPECLRFDDLVAGTKSVVGDVIRSGTRSGAFQPFVPGLGGAVTDGTAYVVLASRLGDSGNEMILSNLTFVPIFATPQRLIEVDFFELGGRVNLRINGDLSSLDRLADADGTCLGNCAVTVTRGVPGRLTVVGGIESFGVGGQAIVLDNLCLTSAEVAPIPGDPEHPRELSQIRADGQDVVLEWSGVGTLQRSADLAGPWVDLVDAGSPYRMPALGTGYFRVRNSDQVSSRVMAYVTVEFGPGYTLFANPLDAGAGRNTLAQLLPGVPEGSALFMADGEEFYVTSFESGIWWDDTLELPPGDGGFLWLPDNTTATVTFTGEVPQGILMRELPAGHSITGALTARKLNLADPATAFPAADGDIVYRWDASRQAYSVYTFVRPSLDREGQWLPEPPALEIAEALRLIKRERVPWIRSFAVNEVAADGEGTAESPARQARLMWNEPDAAPGWVYFCTRVMVAQPPVDSPAWDASCRRLDGSLWVGQLFAGAQAERLEPAGEAVPFATAELAGYLFGGIVTIPQVEAGEPAFAQVRAWEAAAGATYDEAVAAGGVVAASAVITCMTGGEYFPLGLPAPLVGLPSPLFGGTPRFRLEARVEPAGGGTVAFTPAPDIDGAYCLGTVVQCTAVPSPGFEFLGWGGDTEGSELTTTVVIGADRRVGAVFVGPESVRLRFAEVTWVGDGDLQIRLSGPPSAAYALDASIDFVGWSEVHRGVIPTSGDVSFTHAVGLDAPPALFYRARRVMP